MSTGRRTISCRRAAGVALGGLALVLVALLFAAAALFVVGVALALLGAATPAWVWLVGRGTTVVRLLEEDRVVEGEPLEAMIHVCGWLAGGDVLDPLVGAPVRLRGGRRATIRVLSRFERRGPRHLPAPSLVICDPFALAHYSWTPAGPAHDVLVLPRTERVRWGQAGGNAADVGARAQADLLEAVEVDGLRPYRSGTPASRIQWSALARGAGLLERRLRVDGDRTALVLLDPRGDGPDEYLDAAVRAAASLTLELARTGGCRLLLPGARRPLAVESDLVAWPAAHARLALVKGGAAARAPALASIRGALGPVLYVTARPLGRLGPLLEREGFAAPPIVVVLPAELAPGGRASFAVAGCVGIALHAGRRELVREAA
jgi:uncharacterized protein (DUF58 family)